MSARRITTIAAATLTAATLITAGLAAPASAVTRPQAQSQSQSQPGAETAAFVGYGYGGGATAAEAEDAATNDLYSSYACGDSFNLVSDTQNPDGSWWAVVNAECWAIY